MQRSAEGIGSLCTVGKPKEIPACCTPLCEPHTNSTSDAVEDDVESNGSNHQALTPSSRRSATIVDDGHNNKNIAFSISLSNADAKIFNGASSKMNNYFSNTGRNPNTYFKPTGQLPAPMIAP